MAGRVLLISPTGDAHADLARLLGDASITKVFFGDPRHERLGAPIANAVDARRPGGSPGFGAESRRRRRELDTPRGRVAPPPPRAGYSVRASRAAAAAATCPAIENGLRVRSRPQVQIASRAACGDGDAARPRGLANVAGTLLENAPYAKRKRLQRSFGFYRSRPEFGLSHSRHWLSPEQRRYAAADAWATLEVYRKLAATGQTPAGVARVAADDDRPRDGRAVPAPPPRSDALRALARSGGGAPAAAAAPTHIRFPE